LEACAAQVPLPCIMKPVYSQAFRERHRATTVTWPKVIRGIESIAQLQAAFDHMRGFTTEILFQEFVGKYDFEYNAYVSRDGELLADSLHRYIWEFTSLGGFVLDKRLVEEPKIVEATRRVVRELDWRGFCAIEARLGDDGIPYVIELNGRFISEVG